MRSGRGVVSVAGLVLVLAGCWGSEAGPSPTVLPTGRPLDQGRDVVADVRVEATGAVEFVWEGREVLTIARVGNLDVGVSLLSVGFGVPLRLDDPRERFRWAFDLLNAYDDEPGRFVMDPGETMEGGVHHFAVFVHMRVTDDVQDDHQVHDWDKIVFLKDFTTMREPCVVEVGDGVDTGSVSCPALASADGEVVGFTASWKVVATIGEDGELVTDPEATSS